MILNIKRFLKAKGITMMKSRLIYLAAISLISSSFLFSQAAFSATKLSDTQLRTETETNTALVKVPDTFDCDKDMSDAECTRLQYEHYANPAEHAYNEFLKNETTNPLRDKVIKQPLLTQPLQKNNAP